MANCKKCETNFEPSKGLKNFCCISCRNSRSFSEESKNKKSISQKAFFNGLSEDDKKNFLKRFDKNLKGESISKFHTKTWHEKIKITYLNRYLLKTWDELKYEQKRRRVIEEQNDACFVCGNTHWRGIKLSLEIDHINGNNKDDRRENFCALCPNCHSITPTWRGRNKPVKNGDNKISDDILIAALKNNVSIRQALLSVGLAAKGGNYERAKKLVLTIDIMRE